jgi:hypothetical protein
MPERDVRLTIPASVVTRTVGDETVILDLESGTYFGLDPVGSRFLELLGEHRTLGAVLPVMLEEFEVEPGQLEGDLSRLCDEMLAGGLLARG